MKRILVIEDNDQNLYLVTVLLENSGHQVIPAHDGETGIRLADEDAPDLILLDIQLPVMDGYEVARRLRRLENVARIPIVAVTSFAMVGDREKAIAAGCTGYIEKPINPDTFISQIDGFFTSAS
jgi:CheY-like chemotaxis protein